MGWTPELSNQCSRRGNCRISRKLLRWEDSSTSGPAYLPRARWPGPTLLPGRIREGTPSLTLSTAIRRPICPTCQCRRPSRPRPPSSPVLMYSLSPAGRWFSSGKARLSGNIWEKKISPRLSSKSPPTTRRLNPATDPSPGWGHRTFSEPMGLINTSPPTGKISRKIIPALGLSWSMS